MSEWIWVEDRLPQTNVRVLGYYRASASHSGVTWNRNGIWWAVRWENRWSDSLDLEVMAKLDADTILITHWMPLPDPPE